MQGLKYSEYNFNSWLKLMGKAPGQQYVQQDNYHCFISSNGNWPSQITNLELKKCDLKQLLLNLENKAKCGDIPTILKYTSYGQPDKILERIKSIGYKSGQWTAMSHFMSDSWANALNTNMEITEVKSLSELKEWYNLMSLELMGGIEVDFRIFEFMLSDSKCYFFLGKINNESVATSLLYVDDCGNGGVYLVSTDKNYRKRGFGSAVTAICLEKAKTMNCSRIDIQATDLGKKIYQDLGFEPLGFIHVFRLIQKAKS